MIRNIQYTLISLLLLLFSCGQEHWQRQLKDKIAGNWKLDKITYGNFSNPDSVKINVGNIQFTDDLTNPERNDIEKACYYQLEGETNTTRKSTYYLIAARKSNEISLVGFTDTSNPPPLNADPLRLSTTYEVVGTSNDRVILEARGIKIELVR